MSLGGIIDSQCGFVQAVIFNVWQLETPQIWS